MNGLRRFFFTAGALAMVGGGLAFGLGYYVAGIGIFLGGLLATLLSYPSKRTGR